MDKVNHLHQESSSSSCWVENLYEILQSVETGQDAAYRVHTLKNIQKQARMDAPEAAIGNAPARVTRAEKYPTRALARLGRLPDAAEGVTAFIEKRKPTWRLVPSDAAEID